MTTSRPSRARSRTTPPAPAADLARVKAIRDELDARSAEQQQREDALITEYLSDTEEKATIVARRDAGVAALQQQIDTLNKEAEQALAAAEQRRTAALTELSKRRSAVKLGHMFGLNAKVVRKLVRPHKSGDRLTASTRRAPKNALQTCPTEVEPKTAERPLSVPGSNAIPPPRPATEATSATTAGPNPIRAAYRSPTDGAPVPSPKTVLQPPPDETEDQLF